MSIENKKQDSNIDEFLDLLEEGEEETEEEEKDTDADEDDEETEEEEDSQNTNEVEETKEVPEEAEKEEGVNKNQTKEKKPIKKTTLLRDLRNKAKSATEAHKRVENIFSKFSSGDYDLNLKDYRLENGNLDYEALEKAMAEVDVKKRAETRGISPEMQAELERYEKEKQELEVSKVRIKMDRIINNFQIEQKLDEAALNDFIQKALDSGINPLALASLDKSPKGTQALKMLYKTIYVDKIIQERVQEELEKIKSSEERQDKTRSGAPKTNPTQPDYQSASKKISKDKELEDFLKTLK